MNFLRNKIKDMNASNSEGEMMDDDISDSQHDDEIIDSGDEMEMDVKDGSDKKKSTKDPPTRTGSTSSLYFDAAATEESSSSLPAATETQASEEQETPKAKNTAASSESQKRRARIDQELQALFQTTESNELEEGDSIEPEMAEALKKAAYKICYRKRYYNAMQDKFETFPSVIKTVVNDKLFEAAQEFCTSEDYREDGFPLLYTAAMRATASDFLGEDDDDDDNDTSMRDRMAST
ncbi:MAG: hypothetical protein SGARI_006420, partial [Bacillariaceae sp.]